MTRSPSQTDLADLLDEKARQLDGEERRVLHRHTALLRACDQFTPCKSNFCPDAVRRRWLFRSQELLATQFAGQRRRDLRLVRLTTHSRVGGGHLARRLRQTHELIRRLTRSPVWIAPDTPWGGSCFAKWKDAEPEGFEVGARIICVVQGDVNEKVLRKRWRDLNKKHIAPNAKREWATARIHAVKSRTAIIKRITGIERPVPSIADIPAPQLVPYFDQLTAIHKLLGAASFSQVRSQASALSTKPRA